MKNNYPNVQLLLYNPKEMQIAKTHIAERKIRFGIMTAIGVFGLTGIAATVGIAAIIGIFTFGIVTIISLSVVAIMAISLIGYGSKEIDGARIEKNKIDYNFSIEQNPD